MNAWAPIILSTAAAVLAIDLAPAKEPHAPGACIGDLCLDRAKPSEDALVARFGAGHIDNGGETHCYFQKQEQIYFALSADDHKERDREVAWVYVGTKPWLGCTHSLPPKSAFRDVGTPEGLHLGDSEARVRELYGHAPNFEAKQDGSRLVATFGPCAPDCALLEAQIVLVSGRVESILVSEEE